MAPRSPLFNPLAIAFVLATLAACAAVEQIPATMTTVTGSGHNRPVVMAGELQIQLDTGYTRKVKAGSQWLQAGAIAQGSIFRPYQDVFTLEGAHIHEAYLVLDKGLLVGFYLPAERSFSPLKQKIPVTFQ